MPVDNSFVQDIIAAHQAGMAEYNARQQRQREQEDRKLKLEGLELERRRLRYEMKKEKLGLLQNQPAEERPGFQASETPGEQIGESTPIDVSGGIASALQQISNRRAPMYSACIPAVQDPPIEMPLPGVEFGPDEGFDTSFNVQPVSLQEGFRRADLQRKAALVAKLQEPYTLNPGDVRKIGAQTISDNPKAAPEPPAEIREFLSIGLPAYAEKLGKPATQLTPQEQYAGYIEFARSKQQQIPGRDVPLSPDVEAQRTRIGQAGRAVTDPNDAKSIAGAIIDGLQPPTLTGLYRNAAPVRAELARRGYDLTTATRDWQAVQKHLATLNGPQQERLRQAITFTYDSLEIIENLYEEWKDAARVSGYRVLNRANLAASKQLPGKAGEIAQNLEAQINDLTSELGTVYKGGNGSTDESLRLASENLKADWNDATFNRALGQIRTNLAIRRNSILTSQPAGVTPGSPYAPQQLQTLDDQTATRFLIQAKGNKDEARRLAREAGYEVK